MILNPHNQITSDWLTAMDYEVEPIPESSEESADLWAHRKDDCLVVEVKSRIEDSEVVEELKATPVGTIVEYEGTVDSDQSIARIVRKAVGQIEASQRCFQGLGVLWFRPTPILGDLDADERIRSTLLGARIVGYGPTLEEFRFGTCLFAGHNSFHRFPLLDAAVINAKERATLLVNPFGHRKDELRDSRLYGHFKGAVMDLDVMTPRDGMFVLNSDVDRSDAAAVHAALRAQHPELKFAFASSFTYANYVRVQLPRGKPTTIG